MSITEETEELFKVFMELPTDQLSAALLFAPLFLEELIPHLSGKTVIKWDAAYTAANELLEARLCNEDWKTIANFISTRGGQED